MMKTFLDPAGLGRFPKLNLVPPLEATLQARELKAGQYLRAI
jgi:hypothetical protein